MTSRSLLSIGNLRISKIATGRLLLVIAIFVFLITFQINAKNTSPEGTMELMSVSSASEINRFPLPDPDCRGIAFDGEFIWIGEYWTLFKINKTDGTTITSDYNSSRRYSFLTWGGEAFWTSSSDQSKIIKINSSTFSEILSFDHPWSLIDGLAWSNEGLYVYDGSIDKIYLLNSTDGEVISSFNFYNYIGGIAIYEGFLWGTNWNNNEVGKFLKDNGERISNIDLGGPTMNPYGLTFSNNEMWLIEGQSKSIISYDISAMSDLIIYPDQDTDVNSYTRDEINGLSSLIYVRDYREMYMRFPLSKINNLTSAYLEVYQTISDILDVSIYGIQSDLWDQLTMNWNNKLPVSTNEIDTVHILGEGWYQLNVTNFILSQDDGWATFVLQTSSPSGGLRIRSIENTASQYWSMLSINGTVYKSEVLPGAITETKSVTETETQSVTQSVTDTKWDTTTKTETVANTTFTETTTKTYDHTEISTKTNVVNYTELLTLTERLTEINTSNITLSDIITNTEGLSVIYYYPLFVFSIVIIRRKRMN